MKQDYRIKYLIIRYLNGSLEDREAEELARWLSQSEENKKIFRRTAESLSADGSTTPEAFAFWNRFRKENRRLFGYRIVLWKVAAAVAAAAAVVVGFFLLRPSVAPVSQQPPVLAAVQSSPQEQVYHSTGVMHLTLSDGTKVVLNKQSTLSVSASFGEKLREVSLDGEAFFDVAKDSSRLFVVKCNQESYIVRGTSFNITSFADDRMSIVTLHTGALEARVRGDIIKLSPGEELRVDADADNYTKRRVRNAEESAAWIYSDQIIFDDTPLKVVAKRVGTKYGVHINVVPALENILYTGTSESESLPELMRLLELTSPVPIQITGKDGEYVIDRI